ncbi:MAG: GNAT family N-acetyltransferase [Anaerolineae bacterium]|nr:GNAT family N-acetyltransferase [Anaerolineae bacterium]
MSKPWRARRYEPGDEEEILALRRLVFAGGEEGRNSESYWRWEYADCPAGPATIWLAVDDGQVVGHYAVRPVRMQCDGVPLAGSVSLDAMTHPDYRREGIFATLGRETYKDVEGAGLDLTYIWPREVSMRGTIAKFNWVYVFAPTVLVKLLSLASVVGRFVRRRALGRGSTAQVGASTCGLERAAEDSILENGQSRWIDRFDEGMDLFWERVSARHRLATVRDSVYLNWRYFDNPGRQYEAVVGESDEGVLGYVVIRCMENSGLRGGMIVDLGSLPGHAGILSALLAQVEQVFRERRMDLMACLLSGDEEYADILRRQGLRRLPFRLGFKEWYFGCRLNSPGLDRECFLKPANWFLTFGDTDVI